MFCLSVLDLLYAIFASLSTPVSSPSFLYSTPALLQLRIMLTLCLFALLGNSAFPCFLWSVPPPPLTFYATLSPFCRTPFFFTPCNITVSCLGRPAGPIPPFSFSPSPPLQAAALNRCVRGRLNHRGAEV